MVRLHMTLTHLDTLDDVLDLIPLLPRDHTRGINMLVVRSLQEIIYAKQEDRKDAKRKDQNV